MFQPITFRIRQLACWTNALSIVLLFQMDLAVAQGPFHTRRAQTPVFKLNSAIKTVDELEFTSIEKLPKGAIRQFGTTALTHATRVTSIQFSANDRWLATADSNGVVRVWEICTGKMVLEKANGGGRKVAFSPDGRTIALGGYYNQQIIIWDLKSNEYIGSINQNARSLLYSNDGSILYAAGKDKIARAWDTKSKKLLKEFRGHQAELYAVALSPDGKMLATGGGRSGYSTNNEIRLWDANSGELMAVLDDNFDYYEKLPDSVYNLAFSKDGKMLGSAGPYVVRLWNVARKKVIDRMAESSYDIKFSPRDDRFITTGKLRIYDLKSRQPLIRIDEANRAYGVVQYSHNGKWIATGNDQGKIQLWNAKTGKERVIRHGHLGGIRDLSISAGGNMVASISREDSSIRVWGLRTGNELKKIPLQWNGSDAWWNEEGSHVLFAPYGPQVFTWLHDGTVKVWSLEHDQAHDFRLGKKSITLLAFSKDGNRAATVEYGNGRENLISLYDLDGGQLLAAIDAFADKKPYDPWISSLAFSPDGKMLAIGALSDSLRDQPAKSVQLWDLEKVEMVANVRESLAPPGNMEFSPDGQWLATSSTRGTDLEIREVEGNRLVKNLKVPIDAHGREPAPMSFSADGKMFAAADVKRNIFVWDTLTWRKLKSFNGHQKTITAIEFSPDGKTLISSSEDATLIEWQISVRSTHENRLTSLQLSGYWEALADNDSSIAELAINALLQSPHQATDWLADNLDVGSVLDKKELPELIRKVKNEEPKIHLKAMVRVREFGKQAAPLLFREVTREHPPATAARFEELLATINKFPVSPNEMRRKRSIQILERIGSNDAKSVLRKLAESDIRSPACLDAEAALLRLKKIERFQK